MRSWQLQLNVRGWYLGVAKSVGHAPKMWQFDNCNLSAMGQSRIHDEVSVLSFGLLVFASSSAMTFTTIFFHLFPPLKKGRLHPIAISAPVKETSGRGFHSKSMNKFTKLPFHQIYHSSSFIPQ